MEISKEIAGISVDFYFSEKILKQLQLNENDNVFKTNPDLILKQLSLIDYQLVVIGTAHRYFNVFKKIPKKFNTAIIVHNVNFSKVGKFQLLKNVVKKEVIFRVKLLLKESLLSAPKVYEVSKKLVLDKALIQENYKYLPLFFTEFLEENISISEEKMVVIPGAVSQYRRDYQRVFKKIKTIENLKLNVVFLGKAVGNELLVLKSLEGKNPNVKLTYFTEKVPQNLFDEYMKKADVLWCPVQQETEFFSVREFYGLTKMTGNIRDAVKYGKPAIFPQNYKSDYSFIILENQDIENQLILIKNKSLEISGGFEKKEVQKQFITLIDSLI